MAGRTKGFSRRSFLKGSGIVGGAAATGLPEALPVSRSCTVGPAAAPVTLNVNGREHTIQLEPRVTLLNALRNSLDTTGPKEICDRGACGGCTVLLDDRPVLACMMLAVDAQNHRITTVEGLAADGELSPLQRAFLDCDALQCGFCTPGMIMSCEALLRAQPDPSDGQIRGAISGNICRCGTYTRIFQACRRAVEQG